MNFFHKSHDSDSGESVNPLDNLKEFKIEEKTSQGHTEIRLIKISSGEPIARQYMDRGVSDRNILPADANRIIEQSRADVWESGVIVSSQFEGQQVGERIWIMGELLLLSSERPVLRYIKDSSDGWASHNLTKVLKELQRRGVTVARQWEGNVGGNRAWLYLLS
ncbi:MAG: hypothetical protein UT34_C0002G0310 [candidate division WS6 bacterium GW2011_GWF2_39_15]|uniref:Uncharacterized protein n=1 Tax=candidate division WS6 bacterium GW2011_GWF2_39_15 TaxID=1619100 RepID=A0A0G0MRL1_9BACT|nr:MAG: hypothetical protein UT34_C0002G0310 [candidate division WS6 bacterium GW2011_GWF2_39_15]